MQSNLIQQLIAAIDQCLSQQLNAILHHAEFQQLEASWRSLQWLVQLVANDKTVLIKFLDVSYRELCADLLTAIEFDQSQLFHKIYTNEFGQAGGQPFGLLLGDYYFSHQAHQQQRDALGVLSAMSKIAAVAFAPFITGISPSFFGLDQFPELKPSLDLETIFCQAEYVRWQQLRKDEDARFVSLVLPRIQMRTAYNNNGVRLTERYFTETISQHSDTLWGNACYAYARVCINAFTQTGWFADTRGLNPETLSGGVVLQLARECFASDPINRQFKLSTEIAITDQQQRALCDHGFMALQDYPLQQFAVFYSSPSIQKTRQYSHAAANTNAKISSMLHYLLCGARFAHYIKVIIRDKVGSFISPAACQHFLQHWLLNYCSSTIDMPNDSKARYPLHEAKVQVQEQLGSSGKYLCTLQLKPNYQLDELQAELRLVTQLSLP